MCGVVFNASVFNEGENSIDGREVRSIKFNGRYSGLDATLNKLNDVHIVGMVSNAEIFFN